MKISWEKLATILSSNRTVKELRGLADRSNVIKLTNQNLWSDRNPHDLGVLFPWWVGPTLNKNKIRQETFSFRFQLRFHFFDIKKISTICGNKWHDCKLFRFTAQILYQFYFETQLCNSKTKKKINLYFIYFRIPSLISNFAE